MSHYIYRLFINFLLIHYFIYRLVRWSDPQYIHVHDEPIIECSPDVDLNVICKQMGRSPDWMPDILLRADGYETNFYKKD